MSSPASTSKYVTRNASRIGVALLTQAVSSGTNFAMSVFLVRALSPEGFGWQGIGMGLALLYLGIGNALFLTQMVVLTPNIETENRYLFYRDILSIASLFNIITLSVSILISTFLYYTDKLSIYYPLSVAFSAIGLLSNSFFIRYAYVIHNEIMALRINIITSACLTTIMLLIYINTETMSPEISLGAYGLSQLIGASWGLAESGLRKKNSQFFFNSLLFSQVFRHGKWALTGVLVTWLQSQSYVYVTGMFLGVSEVALLTAGRIIVSPFNLLLPALSNLILPRLAEARLQGTYRIAQMTTYYGAFLIGLGITYLLIIFFAGSQIVPFIVGPTYDPQQIKFVSLGWCCVLIFQLSTSAASLGLQASLQFKSLSVLNAMTATVTVVAALPLTLMYGAAGSIFAVGLGEALLGTALWIMLRRNK